MTSTRHHRRFSFLGLLALALTAAVSMPASALQDKPVKSMEKTPPPAQPTAPAADEHKPSADEIIERHIEATNALALKDAKFRISKGEMTIEGQGIKGNITVYQAEPSFFLLELEIPSFGMTRQGFNGEVAWSIDPISGPRILEGSELEAARRDADFHAEMNFKQHYPTRETIGKETFDGKECWKVKLVTPSGVVQEGYYALDTGLAHGLKGELETPQGKLASVAHIKKYETVENVKFAFETAIEFPTFGVTQTITLKSISHEEFSKDKFALPKEIQTLLEVKAEDAKKAAEPKPADAPAKEESATASE